MIIVNHGFAHVLKYCTTRDMGIFQLCCRDIFNSIQDRHWKTHLPKINDEDGWKDTCRRYVRVRHAYERIERPVHVAKHAIVKIHAYTSQLYAVDRAFTVLESTEADRWRVMQVGLAHEVASGACVSFLNKQKTVIMANSNGIFARRLVFPHHVTCLQPWAVTVIDTHEDTEKKVVHIYGVTTFGALMSMRHSSDIFGSDPRSHARILAGDGPITCICATGTTCAFGTTTGTIGQLNAQGGMQSICNMDNDMISKVNYCPSNKTIVAQTTCGKHVVINERGGSIIYEQYPVMSRPTPVVCIGPVLCYFSYWSELSIDTVTYGIRDYPRASNKVRKMSAITAVHADNRTGRLLVGDIQGNVATCHI
mgnify:CR=1 FL=1